MVIEEGTFSPSLTQTPAIVVDRGVTEEIGEGHYYKGIDKPHHDTWHPDVILASSREAARKLI